MSMPPFAMPTLSLGGRSPADPSLDDARESLAYWERRSRTLPRHALRRRREAREMAARWQLRVAEAERARYGRGLLGALVLFAAERRLPLQAQQAGRHVARRTAQVAALFTLTMLAVFIAAVVTVIQVLGSLL